MDSLVDLPAAKLESELAALRGVAGVFAHDLSNPLQSLTVLLELSADEATVGASDAGRIGQSLDAAKSMHTLVHDFVRLMRPHHHAAVETEFVAVLDRCLRMFRRRFDRQNIVVHRALTALETAPPAPPEFAWAFLNLVLGIVNACMTPGYSAFQLDIAAHGGVNHEYFLIVELMGRTRSSDAAQLVFPPDAMRLAQQAVAGTVVHCEGIGATSARFRVDARHDHGARQ
ncbi:MAG: HAMP domain-containing histidine kinase [Myxococcales bacterium FL481]|nr:MAG: HAMP domain-containing histidine kinase [Myxococcales bacterium FL481]